MQKVLTFLFLCFLAFACGNESTDGTGTDAPTVISPEGTDEDRMSQIAPPPPICFYLTEAEVLNLFEAGVKIPMAGSRSPGSFNSCQYTLESDKWSGTLVLEMPETVTKIQAIRDEVAGAKGADAVKIGDFNGRIKNDGRILSVEAAKPFRVKFSALPKQGFPLEIDAAARRELIIKLATAVLQ